MNCAICQKIGMFIIPLALVVGLLAILFTLTNVAEDIVDGGEKFVEGS